MSCHASEDALERYTLGQCSEEESAQIEEHLLVCHVCQDRLNESDLLIKPMRAALAESESSTGSNLKIQKKIAHWFSVPRYAWIPIFASLFLGVLAFREIGVTSGPPQDIALSAFRGAATQVTARASATSPIRLRLDLASLRPASSYRIEVVDSAGAIQRSGNLDGNLERAEFDAGRLSVGTYWVRLYDRTGNLLREYGLTVG